MSEYSFYWSYNSTMKIDYKIALLSLRMINFIWLPMLFPLPHSQFACLYLESPRALPIRKPAYNIIQSYLAFLSLYIRAGLFSIPFQCLDKFKLFFSLFFLKIRNFFDFLHYHKNLSLHPLFSRVFTLSKFIAKLSQVSSFNLKI